MKTRRIRLREWEECVGRLKAVEEMGDSLLVTLSCDIDLMFPGPEAEMLRGKIEGLLGGKVGILRTDKAIYVRKWETADQD